MSRLSTPISTVIGFAIVGTGDGARSHAAALRACAGARLVSCVSRRPEFARSFATEFGCRAETDLRAILDDPSIDAAIVATEPSRHDLAILIAQSGRHVLIEKPLAASFEQAFAIVEACRQAKVVASVVSQRRFDPAFHDLRRFLEEGVIGAPLFAEFTVFARRDQEYFGKGNGWRRGPDGGVTMNLLIHGLDRLLALFGPVINVSASLDPTPAKGVPDRRASILLTFENGVHATLRGSTEFERSWGERLAVTGTKRALVVENGIARLTQTPPGADARLARMRRLGADLWSRLKAGPSSSAPGALARQIEDVAMAIRTGAPTSVTLDDGLAALRVALGAHESHATQRAVRLDAREARA
jgi:UDP-N-acetyl-2-amino-2-deoxyglucuronate dehydrogenase